MTTIPLTIDDSIAAIRTDQDSEDERWRQWKAKGRSDEARFRRTLRTVIVDVGAVAAVAGALWFGFNM